ncbi:hypothetical protein AT279_21820 [Bacillus cereus]|nr:hypothetical protein AT279_21820 [Bacillus cereus]
MITLILLAYIICSLYFSISNTKERYTILGGRIKAMPRKKAFIEGFLTIPVFILIVTIPCGGLVVIGWGLISVCEWILVNMP